MAASRARDHSPAIRTIGAVGWFKLRANGREPMGQVLGIETRRNRGNSQLRGVLVVPIWGNQDTHWVPSDRFRRATR